MENNQIMLSKETKKGRKVENIEIFDIDGTICESFFPNLNEKANIEQLKANILETPLLPAFIEYYKHITQNNNIKTFFLTGRRSKDFGLETKIQLKTLGQELKIIFYPDNYKHSKIRYNTFKIYNILKLAASAAMVADPPAPAAPGAINVFDDLCQYYPKLLDKAGKLGISNIKLHIVKEPVKFWKLKLKEAVLYDFLEKEPEIYNDKDLKVKYND